VWREAQPLTSLSLYIYLTLDLIQQHFYPS
jgi:hypothetical protein